MGSYFGNAVSSCREVMMGFESINSENPLLKTPDKSTLREPIAGR